MSQRTPSHWSAIRRSVSITAARSAGEKASSWTTSGHAGKYGSRPLASTLPATSTNDAGSSRRSSAVPWTKRSGCVVVHGWSGATWFGTKSRIRPKPSPGERDPRRGEAGRAAQPGVDRVVADAVRRPDDVVGCVVGERGPEAGDEIVVRQGDGHPRGAALPHAHQPHRIEPGRGDGVPFLLGHTGQVDGTTGSDAQLVEPRPGVDLVQERMGRRQPARCHGRHGLSPGVPRRGLGPLFLDPDERSADPTELVVPADERIREAEPRSMWCRVRQLVPCQETFALSHAGQNRRWLRPRPRRTRVRLRPASLPATILTRRGPTNVP